MLGLGNSLTGGNISERLAPSYSLSLDGVDDRVTFTETTYAIDDAGDDGSISFWAKRTDNNDEATILGHSGGASFRRLHFDSASTQYLFIEGDQNGQVASAPVTKDTNWHHYVITWEGVDGGTEATVKWYEDGSEITSGLDNTNFGGLDGQDFTIDTIGAAGTPGANTKEFKGLLYQLAIWNVALDGDAVTAIYNSGTPIPIDTNTGNYDNSGSLVNLWRFNESSGSSTSDIIGSLTGTLQDNATFSSTVPTP